MYVFIYTKTIYIEAKDRREADREMEDYIVKQHLEVLDSETWSVKIIREDDIDYYRELP
jgi:hypothetical protein